MFMNAPWRKKCDKPCSTIANANVPGLIHVSRAAGTNPGNENEKAGDATLATPAGEVGCGAGLFELALWGVT
jgi:hypothetical protein